MSGSQSESNPAAVGLRDLQIENDRLRSRLDALEANTAQERSRAPGPEALRSRTTGPRRRLAAGAALALTFVLGTLVTATTGVAKTETMYAVVLGNNQTGILHRKNGVQQFQTETGNMGQYHLTFVRNITSCAIVGSVISAHGGLTHHVLPSSPTTLHVNTWELLSSPDGLSKAARDASFTVHVTCKVA